MSGIWNSILLNNRIGKDYQLTLGEGNTKLDNLDSLFFKREDLNPTGSIKDRGMAYQISYLYSLGINKVVISSSGNAAISCVKYANLANIQVTAFLPENADESKRKVLEIMGCRTYCVTDSLKEAGLFAKENNAYLIRPSINPEGHWGFMSLGEELNNEEFDWIVFPVSSGTTLFGTYEGLKRIGYKLPKILVVQTSYVNSISHEFDQDFIPEGKSLATGIVSVISPKKRHVIELINETNGTARTVDNQQIQNAWDYLHRLGINASYDASVAMAGWKKFTNMKKQENKKVAIIITGTQRSSNNE